MPSGRRREIDTAKGIGILLVVLCHAISPVMKNNVIMNNVYGFIYTFHMPLFFFLAGVVAPINKKDKKKQTCSKIERLMIPYFAWAIIYSPLKIMFADLARNAVQIPWWSLLLGNNPDGELWFLYVLFLLSLVVIWCLNENNKRILLVLALIITFFSPLFSSKYAFPGISLSFSCYQIGFYALGIYCSARWEAACNWIQKKNVSLASFVICTLYGAMIQWGGYWWIKSAVTIVSIIFLMSISIRLSKSNGKISGALDYLGCHSMEIYIIHAPILIIGRKVLPHYVGKNWGYVIVLTTLAVVLSLIIDKCILNRWQWMGRLLVGKKCKED